MRSEAHGRNRAMAAAILLSGANGKEQRDVRLGLHVEEGEGGVTS